MSARRSEYSSAASVHVPYAWQVSEPGIARDVVRPDVVASSSGGLAGLVNTALRREQIRYPVVAGSTSACYLGILAVLLATGLPYMIAILTAQAIIIAVAFPVYRRLI